MTINIYKKILMAVLFLIPLLPIKAFEIQNTDSELKGDFVLETAKIEISLDPGTSETRNLRVLNRSNKTLNFKVEIEDFSGSQNPNQTVILAGEEKGPYSLKDYLFPELTEFTLQSGQRISLPIRINIPKDAEAGGLYGAVLISNQAFAQEETGAVMISRLGALFFVDVKGEVIKNGKLIDFKETGAEAKKINFELLFENKGSVHLNPYGVVKIFNLFGKQVDEIKIDPYFAMPDSVRYREIIGDRGDLLGRYKAEAILNRGYNDLEDKLSLTFWVVSIKMVITFIGVILLIALIIRWAMRNFNFSFTRRKFKI